MSTYTIIVRRKKVGHAFDLVAPDGEVLAKDLTIPDRVNLCHEDDRGVALAINMQRLISEGMVGIAGRLNGSPGV